ncbi:MAG: excinuclease ABC subunit UvrC [Firmicutes bacterium]|nr:excinuclease ABC subunit UvrC [Bacillota bacterium]
MDKNTFNIPEELKKLPEKPGVYIMKDEKDAVIYVGKAKILKNRVRSYFQNLANHTPKTKRLVSQIVSFEYIITGSEVEALILENSLIKKHSPKYNINLKDDKTYPYIKITVNEDFPVIYSTRRHEKDKAKYFGPYTGSTNVRENIDLIHKLWKIRSCKRKIEEGKPTKPCLNYHIGLCNAPCAGYESREEYALSVAKAVDFLSGKIENTEKELEGKMLEYSENMEYEKAAEIRDNIKALKTLRQRQIIESMHSDERDVIAYARDEENAVFQVFFIRSGIITGREHFFLNDCEGTDNKELITKFTEQFYSGTPYIPKEILIQSEIENTQLISDWLSEVKGKKVSILVPLKGEKKNLVRMATGNAMLTLEKFGSSLKKEYAKTKGALKELQEALGIDFPLNRIESYDISNTRGFESVASMVVYEEGKPKKSDYRKFRIRSVQGPDDYASMYEVITRRFKRYLNAENADENARKSFEKMPDMIFLDGGEGQISSVTKALAELNLQGVRVCGMVKDDRHRTRALLYKGEERMLPINSEGFKLLTRIQDEVHRFAIEYHRSLRSKKQVKSILDDIEGIGEKRRKALLLHFGDVEKIGKASLEELSRVDGMNSKSAEAVYAFFRKNKT